MSTVLKYSVIDSQSVELLVVQVQNQIALGWQPLGGPFQNDDSFCQAMVFSESGYLRAVAAAGDTHPATESDLIHELTEDDEPFPMLSDHLERTGT